MDTLQRSTILVTVILAVALQPYAVCGEWMEIRLRGSVANEGRLEIRILQPTKTQHVRQWGTVCDDHWDLADSMVACRMLGFTAGGLLVHQAQQTAAAGGLLAPTFYTPILMDDVQCSGGEISLEQCVFDDTHDCEHHEDVYLRCFGSQVHNSSDVSLQPSSNNDLALILVGIATQLTTLSNQSASVLQELQSQKQNLSQRDGDSGASASSNQNSEQPLRKQLSDELETLKLQQSFLWTMLCLLVLCFFVGFVSLLVFVICAQRRDTSSRWCFGGKASSSPYEVPILTRHDSFGMVNRDGITENGGARA